MTAHKQSFLRHALAFIRDRFSLDEDRASQQEVVESVSRSVVFRGTNVWVLVFAALIASLGLNVNSTAVVIGAMLISPLMAPIMGIGLALGINDFELLKKSLRNFGVMTAVAIVTAFLYFLITPENGEVSRELLARTEPTVFDVLIALFGGLAGIVAQTRKDRTSTVIPGVAIATALMPPLCTAGFGLATHRYMMFGGAFYLFFINAVFIALAAFLVVRFQHYHKVELADLRRERRARRVMFFIVVVTFVPSVYIGTRIVRRSVFEASADRYVKNVLGAFDKTRVLRYDRTFEPNRGQSRIEVMMIGDNLPSEVVEAARAQLPAYHLRGVELVVHQTNLSGDMDTKFLEKNFAELLAEKNDRITRLERRASALSVDDAEAASVAREAAAIFGNVRKLAISRTLECADDGRVTDTVAVCVLTPRDASHALQTATVQRWLQARLKIQKIKLFVDTDKPATDL